MQAIFGGNTLVDRMTAHQRLVSVYVIHVIKNSNKRRDIDNCIDGDMINIQGL